MLEPLPETAEALAELISLDGPELDDVILDLGRAAQQIVPDLVGLSLALLSEGLTLTLVASGVGVAGIDATQYLDGGPCVHAAEHDEVVEAAMDDLLDEGRWQLFARTSAAMGVASSLSMPLLTGGLVTGGINLYASTPDAFTGHHQALATALGGSATDAVANADLSFDSRLRAADAPAHLQETREIETAVGMIAGRDRVDLQVARARLRNAAVCAGVTEAFVARVLILVHAQG
jgi:GAF domain-containing protein